MSLEDEFCTPIPDPGPPGGESAAVGDSLEPLVVVHDPLLVRPAYTGGTMPRGELPLRVRAGAARRLTAAQKRLPPPFQLVVLDGWRSVRFQQALVDYYGPHATAARYVAATDSEQLVAPHVTGGAVDVTLGWDGEALALGCGFDDFSARAGLTALERDDSPSPERILRRILYVTLIDAGFAPYQLEWWHFSFGDQHWAAFCGRPQAIYGQATS